ncbi:3-mercaptopyruvate sulfurtransferase [Rouxiella badensis]|uniref:3-mercaptopyruvate sulfurtransferase n=1 Tax=Rouxiella badensis TaxID=1646377 RepID=UPI001D158CC8|nr:3-mercaptopyruvate sulfurtransferase [Rouxiella badensis]MCC3717115.1 3-mercaptopyruvate sulfurtransferase [Rouxiella badensis]MCC3728211.1 3-mercaptopyruvate sulfurtransferase [Rouxiella badensis]MCC3732115.1 3-mercaptopyruvate sulfurtransferase [Rouxiella badensis]MCC3739955.1 3-mercaptopyruvate sulfurtransferase [Rouxiella badensis]MCC3758996.1 3-mercaptopyruvate sulfurtransferase [Rouxiella badensis]
MSSSIVSTDWLASHLDQSGLVIIDCRKSKPGINPPIDFHGKYLEAHIPGAVYVEVDDISDCSTGLPHMLPDAEAFSKSMSERGISNNSAVVLYDEGDLFSAPRVWWMLTRFGANNVRILDGGLNAWLKEGKRTEGGERKLPPANFEARLESQVVVSAEQVKQALGKVQIIDARSLGRFRGEQPEPRPGLHGGHIPGSLSVPFTELTENGRIKSPQALKETFSRLGVDTTQRTISSCGSGVTAAALLFGLHLIGAEDVLIYDGSWAEWGDINKDYPIETQ